MTSGHDDTASSGRELWDFQGPNAQSGGVAQPDGVAQPVDAAQPADAAQQADAAQSSGVTPPGAAGHPRVGVPTVHRQAWPSQVTQPNSQGGIGSANSGWTAPPAPPAPPERFNGSPPVSPTPVASMAATSAASPAPGVPSGPPLIDPIGPRPSTDTTRSTGWGWRSFVAFLAGGALTAGGFGLGFASNGDTQSVAAGAGETIPASAPPAVVVPPDLDTSEPAAFVANLLGPSVVQVEHLGGLGSGVVFRDGLVLTNNHVIEGAEAIRIRTSDGRLFEATLLGADPRVDIAVLDVGANAGLPVAELAVDDELEVGQYAVAIGSPFQLQQTVTSGIISAVNRPIQTSQTIVNAMIQTDTAINPGNSGGALADRSGRVIGINTAIQTDGTSNSNVGVGFAVPIDTAVATADRIIAGLSLEPGFLGVGSPQEPANGEAGVVIGSVEAGSAADDAGFQVGDRVIKFDGAPVTSLQELAGLVQTRYPGDSVETEVVRNGETLILTAVLGER